MDCLNVRISELEHDREKFLGEVCCSQCCLSIGVYGY